MTLEADRTRPATPGSSPQGHQAAPGKGRPAGLRPWGLPGAAGLRLHIAALLAATLLPALVAGGVAAGVALRDYRATFEARLLDTARALRLALDSEIETIGAALQTLTASPLLLGAATPDRGKAAVAPDLAAFHAQAAAAAARLGAYFALLDRDGARILATDQPFGAALPPSPRMAELRRAIDEDRRVVSGIATLAIPGRPAAAVIEPVRPPGVPPERGLALLGRLEPERLSRLLAAQGLSATAFATLVDAQGRVVARSRDAERLLGLPVPAWFAPVSAGREHGLARGPNVEGEHFVLGFDRLDAAPGWIVVVAEPWAAYRAAWLRPLLAFSGGGLLALAAAGGIGAWLTRRLLRPVDALARGARAIALNPAGRTDAIAALPPASIAEFEQMRLGLAEAEAALREREERLRRVLDTLTSCVVLLTPAGRVVEANLAPLEGAGIGIEEVRGRFLWDCPWWSHDPAQQERLRAACTRAAAGEAIGFYAEVCMAGDGRRAIEFRVAPLRDPAGRVSHLVASAVDITARKAAEAALAEKEARLRLAQEAAGAGALEVDFRTGRVRLSPESLRLHALPGDHPAEFDEAEWARMIHPEDRAPARLAVMRAVAERGLCDFTFRVPLPDGSVRWIQGMGRAEYDPDGRPLRLLGLNLDVTARKVAEAARAESEARFRAMADSIPQLAWMARPDGWIVWYNRRWYEATGTTPEEMLGWGWRKVHHQDHVERVTAHFRRCIETGEPWEDTFPLRCVTAAGGHEYRWFLSRALPIRDAAGRVEAWFGTNTDITAQREAEAANAHLAALVTSATDAVVSFSAEDGRIITWNRGAEALFGWTEAEAVGGPVNLLVPPDLPEGDPHGVLFRRVMAGERVQEFESVRLHKSGERIPVAINGTRIFAPDGRVIGVSGIIRDLRPRRAAEAALREREERLRLALEGGRLGTWDRDLRTGASAWSAQAAAIWGLPEGEGGGDYAAWHERVHPEDRARISAAFTAHLAGQTPRYELEYRYRQADGSWRWIATSGQVVARDPETGAPLRAAGVIQDVTERKAAEERQTLLIREVDHRARNALAVVQSILALTRADEPVRFAEAVKGRVAALARAHTLLARDRWEGGDLGALARQELTPFGAGEAAAAAIGGDGPPPRVLLEGPPATLVPEAVQPLAMALHELATNATKHGALSAAKGRVELCWRRDAEDGGLRLFWRERGGPPLSGPPSRRGFGSSVVEATIRRQLGGQVAFDWDPAGLCCELRIPAVKVRWQPLRRAAVAETPPVRSADAA